ncbi:DUF6531 domain-containing protein [Dyella acidisoli]|uniref:DUF6531 domain-containing protein n=1 Tax=Dyella acidisoli TaxID=1867834 RepID=A0ABQ5XP23_9GAMM|nr:DUF6531 domain-containing protein [Dyella acidisoli]GLQ93475.1 hypothetical protein GCM10007901_24260 [Dyella acidisoli]
MTDSGGSRTNIIGVYDCSYNPSKNVGSVGHGSPLVGDPINAAIGNKFLEEVDYEGGPWLTFRRDYNSYQSSLSAIGYLWRHSFDRSLTLIGNPITQINLLRPDGTQELFTQTNNVWTSDSASIDTLTANANAQGAVVGYTVFDGASRHFDNFNAAGVLQSETDETGNGITLTYSTSSTPTSIAPKSGLLITVTDPNGRQLHLTYNSSGNVSQVTQPDGGVLAYTYDSSNNLASVQYPDGKTKQYVYNESSLTGGNSLPNAMTGIIDEASSRYANTAYNSYGQAISSSFAGNAFTTQITYNSDGSSTVQYSLGQSVNLSFAWVNGFNRVSSASASCNPSCNQPWKTLTYDSNSNPASYTDFNGNVTTTTYDPYWLLNQRIEASGTSNQRTTNLTWNDTLRLPLSKTISDANGTLVTSTQWVYNNLGQALAKCDIDASNSAASGYSCSNSGTTPSGVRRWTYTYCNAIDSMQCPLIGLMLTATGPRADTTQTTAYNYYMNSSAANCGTPGAACYQTGDLHTVTDPQGHVTTIGSYDADGRITRVIDANGINTDMTYTPRGWLASRNVGGATTSFTYTPYGAVQTVTDPDGVITTYSYDAAHRLAKVTDSQGNYIQYTLDAAGNKTAEQVFDSSGTSRKSLTRTFNALGQLTKTIDGLNHTVFDASASGSYDANGNLVQSADGLGIQRQLGYDALNRLVQTLDNYNGTN